MIKDHSARRKPSQNAAKSINPPRKIVIPNNAYHCNKVDPMVQPRPQKSKSKRPDAPNKPESHPAHRPDRQAPANEVTHAYLAWVGAKRRNEVPRSGGPKGNHPRSIKHAKPTAQPRRPQSKKKTTDVAQ